MKIRPFTHRIGIDIALVFGLIVLVVGKVGGQDKDLVEAARTRREIRKNLPEVTGIVSINAPLAKRAPLAATR